jgi:hypothetical protein
MARVAPSCTTPRIGKDCAITGRRWSDNRKIRTASIQCHEVSAILVPDALPPNYLRIRGQCPLSGVKRTLGIVLPNLIQARGGRFGMEIPPPSVPALPAMPSHGRNDCDYRNHGNDGRRHDGFQVITTEDFLSPWPWPLNQRQSLRVHAKSPNAGMCGQGACMFAQDHEDI